MNINDPFGRMQGRRERDYQSLKESLQKAGLSNHADAQQLRENMGKRCRLGLAIVIPFTLLLAVLFSKLWMFTLIFGGLISLWLVNTSRRSQEFIDRYMEEELGDREDDSASF